ncbi:MAG: preprotein translocase subunit YajC [Candidatus Methylacidiphilales bacterium]
MIDELFLILAFAPAPVEGQEAPPFWVSLMPMVLIFVIFYFMLIRPQQKRAREHEALIKSVKSGDKVIAAGGILGVVTNVKENTVVLKVADNVKIEVQKNSIATVERGSSETSS